MNTVIMSLVIIGNTLLPATFCEGVKLDKTLTYSEWLHEYALPTYVANQYAGAELAQRKYDAYLVQAANVKRGQVAKCGAISPNWK
jgi:hypothetical protein